jgi:Flp pilus assembly protein TadG
MQRTKTQKGSAMVESAFIFTVVACLLLGIFDVGQMLFRHQALVQRARSAARWGAISSYNNTTAIQNKILYNQTTALTDQNGEAAAGYFGLTASNVTVQRLGTSGTDNDRLSIRITSPPFHLFSPFVAGDYTGRAIEVDVPLGMFN